MIGICHQRVKWNIQDVFKQQFLSIYAINIKLKIIVRQMSGSGQRCHMLDSKRENNYP